MAKSVVRQIMLKVCALPPETGGILLGPIGTDVVTAFHFDQDGRRTAGTYSPDHVGLGRMMRDIWMPNGLDLKGFTHSHPGGYDQLSNGDLDYIQRFLHHNPDMQVFAAPIVLPQEFRIRPFVVLRTDPARGRRARLTLVDG